MIRVKSISYRSGGFALHDIDFGVQDGETFVVLGPTGAGKTVLLEIIAGFRSPQTGVVEMDGRNVTRVPPERRKIGFVYQDHLLFPHMSVHDNIAYGLNASSMKRPEIEAAVADIASKMGISHLLGRRTRRLSGGEAQRVALARALVTSPRLLLLDEPFAAVDPATKERLVRETRRLLEQWRIPVIHVTHDQTEAGELADRIAVMNEGRIVQTDVPERIFREPRTEFVAGFVGVKNILRGQAFRREGGVVVRVDGLELRSSVELEGSVHVTIRPEDIVVSRERVPSSARNSVPGIVRAIVQKGPVIYLTADCGVELTAAITKESLDDMRLSVGDEVFLTFKASNVNLF